MSKNSISAHMVVKNEQNWIWYAIMSVLDYVDEFLIIDTGSTDRTVEIVNSISSPKIKFREIGEVNRSGVTQARQFLLEQTTNNWIFTIDGDEIWPDASITQTIEFINSAASAVDFLIHPNYNCLGDVFHYQESAGGRYCIGPYSGSITTRFVNRSRVPGLHHSGQHGHEGLYDENNILIQDRQPFKGFFLDLPYIHTTHLQRTSSTSANQVFLRRKKFKYELGLPFPSQFIYPSVFFLPQPAHVPSPWKKRGLSYILPALWQTPLKMIKRRI